MKKPVVRPLTYPLPAGEREMEEIVEGETEMEESVEGEGNGGDYVLLLVQIENNF